MTMSITPTQETALHNLERRICELEQRSTVQAKQLKRSRAWCAGLGLLLTGAGLMAAAPLQNVQNVVAARRFELLDEKGNLVMLLAPENGAGRMDIWNSAGTNLARIDGVTEGGQFVLWNSAGEYIAGTRATTAGSEFELLDANGKVIAKHTADASGGRVTLNNAAGAPALTAGSAPEGADLRLMNAAGEPRLTLGAMEAGGRVSLSNDAGSEIISAGTSTSAGGVIDIRNADGEIAISAQADGAGAGLLRSNGGDGEPRFTAGSGPNGGIMQLASDQGLPTFSAGTIDGRGGGYCFVMNAQGERIITAASDDTNCGRLELNVANGQPVITMNALQNHGALFAMLDASGEQRCALTSQAEGGLITLTNPVGPILTAGYSARHRGGSMTIRNERGVRIFHAGPNESSASGEVTVWDADGRTVRTLETR